MDSTGFIPLSDAVLAPPFNALVALLLAIGMWEVGRWIGDRFRDPELPASLTRGIGFVVVGAALAVVVHALALLGLTPAWLLRLCAVSLGLLGVYALRRAPECSRAVSRCWRQLESTLDRAALVVAGLVALGLLLVALGPPTNADSLDYHLGVPLDWLGQGGAAPRHDWITARLAGIGEALNLLGLAAGSDAFGAVVQWSGLLVAIGALRALAPDAKSTLLAVLLVVSVPTMAFLAPSQKPQLLPAAGLVAGLVAVVGRAPGRTTLAGSVICIGFAVACKHSFLLSGGLATLAVLWTARRERQLPFTLAMGVAAFVLIPGQVYLRNILFYGDPLSPLLEPMLSNPDEGMVAFAEYLRTYGGELTLGRLAWLPWDLMVTLKPGSFSRVLGVGVLAFVAAVPARSPTVRTLLWLALAAFGAILLLGQPSPRFFLVPYLWASGAAVAAAASTRKRALGYLLAAQAVLCLTAAGVGAAQMFPGALTPALRDDVMHRTTYGYSDARWMDRVLPEDATMMASRFRSRALAPRPFAVASGILTRPMSEAEHLAYLDRLVRRHGIDTVVLIHPEDESPAAPLGACAGRAYGEPVELRKATRNPFNRGHTYGRRAFALDFDAPACPLDDGGR